MLKITPILTFTFTLFYLTLASDRLPYISDFGLRTLPAYPYPPILYDINLDLDYEDRWREVIADRGPSIQAMYNTFLEKTKIPPEIINSVNYTVMAAHDLEFAKELVAIAKLLGMTFEQACLLNAFFDASPRCSGAIIQDADDRIYHGRNLDNYDADLLGPLMFQGRYFKNGKMVYQAITKIGELGVLTGIKRGSFAISLNQHEIPFLHEGDNWKSIKTQVFDIYAEFLKSYQKSLLTQKQQHLKKIDGPMRKSSLLLARHAIENCDTFEEAVDMVTNYPTLSKASFMISGTKKGEGVVIVRSKDQIQNKVYLNADQGVWYIVQSNYRRDIHDPPHDNRRTFAEDTLDLIGRDRITEDLLFDLVLTKYPMFCNATLHSSVMKANTGEFITAIWGWDKYQSALENERAGTESIVYSGWFDW